MVLVARLKMKRNPLNVITCEIKPKYHIILLNLQNCRFLVLNTHLYKKQNIIYIESDKIHCFKSYFITKLILVVSRQKLSVVSGSGEVLNLYA